MAYIKEEARIVAKLIELDPDIIEKKKNRYPGGSSKLSPCLNMLLCDSLMIQIDLICDLLP